VIYNLYRARQTIWQGQNPIETDFQMLFSCHNFLKIKQQFTAENSIFYWLSTDTKICLKINTYCFWR
jgi:hypothetical protein